MSLATVASRAQCPARDRRRRRAGTQNAGSDAASTRLVFLGDDAKGTTLEVMAVELEGGSLLVIHAMPLRDRYRKQYEEVKNGEAQEESKD